jgi:beta-galactosidase
MIRPGAVWRDTNGEPIQAHGGGLLRDADGTYFWYGEDKGATNSAPGRVDVIGVHCYASRNLVTWEDRGVVLPAVPDDESHDLFPANVLERPKVLRCPATGKYVLWAHVDSPDYAKASLGVAVADAPDGPFRYRHSFRPEGRDSRDMTVFQDEDGAAYVFFSSQGWCPPEQQWPKDSGRHTFRNATLRIARLTDDYTGIAGPTVEAFPGEMREAPAVWRWRGRCYMVTSGCTGWKPNPARWHVADSPLGPWETMGDPVAGTEAQRATTFDAQSTYVLPDPCGDPNRFVFCADRWVPDDLRDSRYVWLPLMMSADGTPRIEWRDAWAPGGS